MNFLNITPPFVNLKHYKNYHRNCKLLSDNYIEQQILAKNSNIIFL